MRKKDEKIRLHANAMQWKSIGDLFEDVGGEDKNHRLCLCMDGMTPHRSQNNNYSTLSILLIIYNLLLWFCMNRRCLIMSLLG